MNKIQQKLWKDNNQLLNIYRITVLSIFKNGFEMNMP